MTNHVPNARDARTRRTRRLASALIACALGAGAAILTAQQVPAPAPPAAPVIDPDTPYTDEQGDQLRRQTCTRCHNLPPPDVLPRERWRDAIARMWLRRDNRAEPVQPGAAGMLQIPEEFVRIARWYRTHAPDQLPPPDPWPDVEADGPSFRRHGLTPPRAQPIPAVSNVSFADLDGDSRLELLVTDMRYGLALVARPYALSKPMETLGTFHNLAHASVVDLDGDGIKDVLLAELGDFNPSDHDKGAVIWLRGGKDGRYTPFQVEGLPRIADVEAADLDADGRLDLLVAAFGWRKTGQTMALMNRTTDWKHPSFVSQTLDARAGGIHVIPRDLDGDARTDLVVLLSQQHERVIALYNNGPGAGYAVETLYAAPHPNWGSSGMQLVDLDGDGDLDVLLSHGDTLDDFILKPYHGIQWLENTGNFQMVEHTLATMPGVFRALAADMDGDGDLDVVATACIPFELGSAKDGLASLVWLEQTARGTFVKHTLEKGRPQHATLDATDMDGDGDLDLAVGNFTTGLNEAPWVEVWENLRIQRSPAKPSAPARRPVPKTP